MTEKKNKHNQSFVRETLSMLWDECMDECKKPHLQKQLQENICDPLLNYCIQQLSPYYLLLVIIFIILLIIISILLAFIIFTYNDSRRI